MNEYLLNHLWSTKLSLVFSLSPTLFLCRKPQGCLQSVMLPWTGSCILLSVLSAPLPCPKALQVRRGSRAVTGTGCTGWRCPGWRCTALKAPGVLTASSGLPRVNPWLPLLLFLLGRKGGISSLTAQTRGSFQDEMEMLAGNPKERGTKCSHFLGISLEWRSPLFQAVFKGNKGGPVCLHFPGGCLCVVSAWIGYLACTNR